MQRIGHLLRRHQILLHMVKTAAVHTPGFAMHALRQMLTSAQRQIQPNEVKRTAYPCDAGNNVQPAQQQAGPINNVCSHND